MYNYSLLNWHSKLNLNTKLLIYKILLKPIWSYGIQLWGTAKKTNIDKIQTIQLITLRMVASAPPYLSNHTLHSDFKIQTILETATKTSYKLYHACLAYHSNPLISALNCNSISGDSPSPSEGKSEIGVET